MKFAVGYQLSEENEEPFVDVVRDYTEHISEVYFPWIGAASGRTSVGDRQGYVDWAAQSRLEDDLKAFRKMGLNLDILFNANCYGDRAVSQNLQNEILSVLHHLQDVVEGVDTVTTTSPAVAHVVQTHFPDVGVRASVNMRIGSTESMDRVSDLFDSFYLQRDYQRDIEYVRKVSRWCEENGKALFILANSGCLRLCPHQIFHDNMVAHDRGVSGKKGIEDFNPYLCWKLYEDRENWPAILQATWIRPEDLHHYEGLIKGAKLATRIHSRPRAVLEAYTTQRWRGNLLDLMEPFFSSAFAPYVIDNSRFPDDWFETTSTCSRDCQNCDYCQKVLERVMVRAG